MAFTAAQVNILKISGILKIFFARRMSTFCSTVSYAILSKGGFPVFLSDHLFTSVTRERRETSSPKAEIKALAVSSKDRSWLTGRLVAITVMLLLLTSCQLKGLAYVHLLVSSSQLLGHRYASQGPQTVNRFYFVIYC